VKQVFFFIVVVDKDDLSSIFETIIISFANYYFRLAFF